MRGKRVDSAKRIVVVVLTWLDALDYGVDDPAGLSMEGEGGKWGI